MSSPEPNAAADVSTADLYAGLNGVMERFRHFELPFMVVVVDPSSGGRRVQCIGFHPVGVPRLWVWNVLLACLVNQSNPQGCVEAVTALADDATEIDEVAAQSLPRV